MVQILVCVVNAFVKQRVYLVVVYAISRQSVVPVC